EKDSSLGLQVLHTLLSHQDISVSVEDGDGRQPLLWAASAGSAKAVLALIRAGAAVESHDKDGLTALHCTASRGHTDCIDTLLTLCGASPDVIDSNGCTALHYAVTLGHADATALLLAHAADPNRQDRKGRSPAHCGCAKGQFETVKMLGSHGANLWLRNARGDLPLHEAAASGRRDLVRWLLEARPSQVNARNNDGRCPLHLAALNDNADMCKILLDAGAQINPILRTSKNVFMTPLDCALQRGFRSTAKYLQLHGGVPANRLGGISQQPQGYGSAVSLQIRDDVTLWGDSSSESEKEEAEKSKTKKKSYKRKLAYKYERKKGPVLLSEYDSEKLTSGKLESEPTHKGKDAGKGADVTDQKERITPHLEGFPFLGNNIPPGEIFIYANEVNINDKFGGVNIKQDGEVAVSDTTKISRTQAKSTTTQVASSVKGSASSTSEKQEKRPKSAKYGRLKNKSGRQSDKTDSARKKTYVDTPDPRRKQTDEEFHSSNIDEEIPEIKSQKEAESSTTKHDSAVKRPEVQQQVKGETSATSKPEQPTSKMTTEKTEIPRTAAKRRMVHSDQQSARSNTSYEDGEDHKQLVVEASVHSPPREISEGAEASKQTLEISEVPQERRRTPIGSEILSGDDLGKIDVMTDQDASADEGKDKKDTESPQSTQKTSDVGTAPTKIEISTAVAESTTSIVGTAAAVAQAAATKETESPPSKSKKEDVLATEIKAKTEIATAAQATKPESVTESATTAQTSKPEAVAKSAAADQTSKPDAVTESATTAQIAKSEAATEETGTVGESVPVSEATTTLATSPAVGTVETSDATASTKVHKSDSATEAAKAIAQPDSTETKIAEITRTASTEAVTDNVGAAETADVKTATSDASAADTARIDETVKVTDTSKTATTALPTTETKVVTPEDAPTVITTTHEEDMTKQDQTEEDLLEASTNMAEQAGMISINIEQPSSPSPAPSTEQEMAAAESVVKSVQSSFEGDNIKSSEVSSQKPSGEVDRKPVDVDKIQKASEEIKDVPSKTKDVSKTKKSKQRKRLESDTSSEAVEPLLKKPQRKGDKDGITEEKTKSNDKGTSHKKKRKIKESSEKPSKVIEVIKTSLSSKQIESPPDSSIDVHTSEESESESPSSSSPSSTVSITRKEHRSFQVLDEDDQVAQKSRKKSARQKSTSKKKPRSQSEENKVVKISEQVSYKEHERLRRSKIPTPVMNLKTPLSKSDKHLDRSAFSGEEPRVPSLPNIRDSKDGNLRQTRSVSNLSAPLAASTYSDNDHETGSEEEISSATRRKRLRKRSKTRSSKSAGSDYESSNLIDSGFEPSPRSSRIPKWKNMSERGVNMTSVTQTIQSNIRRYHLERKIFQHLLDLKRLQIRSGQHNEAVLVKRAIDAYHRSCAATVGAGKYTSQDFSFRSFENFLYNSLRKIQRTGIEHLQGLPETPRNPLHCTQRTHRCDHATHAYTGVPCAAYLPKMDHHTIPKIGFECKPSGFLPKIHPKSNAVTLELCHGNDKQVISLPAERLDQNKRYYVTFTVKGNENSTSTPNEESAVGHRHSKSD
ncbi:hypothetical protein ILUMI_01433, partial [Ignelater luminosus]